MSPIILSVLGVSALLATISIVVPIARRLLLPYTLVLAVLGVLIGLLGYFKVGVAGFGGNLVGGLQQVGLLGDAFIYIYLPPLLFAAGLTVDVRHILEDVWHVLLLAFVAVVVCTLFVGGALAVVTEVGVLPCFLLGTIVSTTDTAAVINIFREVGAPKRLSAIVEGEALFNDAAAIAMFTLFLDMVVGGTSLDLFSAARDFVLALLGGAMFGYGMARLCGWLISLLQDAVTTEVTLTIAMAYFTFVVGNEVLNVSGVVATVTLAIVIGSEGRTRVSPGSWESLQKVWEHLDFWATSMIFVTSAMYVPQALRVFDWNDLANVGVVFVAALASRAFVIWGLMPTFSVIGASKPLDNTYKAVLWWGGMRGAVTVALALATTTTPGVPEPARHLIASCAIGYVIASLVINGLSLRPLMNRLRLAKLDAHDLTVRSRILTLARRRVSKELNEVAAAIGLDADELSRTVVPSIKKRAAAPVSLEVALEVWCQHETETTLSFRERGLLTRYHADLHRTRASRLLNALSTEGIEGYRAEVRKLSAIPATVKLPFWFYRHLRWEKPLAIALANRMEQLIGELLIMRELVRQCEHEGEMLFGKQVMLELRAILRERADTVERELTAIGQVSPDFADAMRKRHLALVALGLLESEYQRHLAEATISTEVFSDLDAQRRSISAKFGDRPILELQSHVAADAQSFPLLQDFPALQGVVRPYLTFPGQPITPNRRNGKSIFFVVSGQVELEAEDGNTRVAGPGQFFSHHKFMGLCAANRSATSADYGNLLEVSFWRLRALIKSDPEMRKQLECRKAA